MVGNYITIMESNIAVHCCVTFYHDVTKNTVTVVD